MHRLLIAGIVALLACGGDAESNADSAPPADPPAAAPAGQPTAGVSDASSLDVTLAEWRVQLSRDSVPAGLVSLRVRNAGTMPHRLEVEGNGDEVETDDLEAGTEITMTMNLPAGTYELYCPIDAAGIDHDARGMRTRLRVY